MKPSDRLIFSCLYRALLPVLLLSGCASAASGWQKGGVTDTQRNADYAECKSEMRASVGSRLGVDQDIESTRGSDWRQSGTYDMNVSSNSGADRDYANHVLYSCMVDKGYHPRS